MTWATSIASRPAAMALDARPSAVAQIQPPRWTGASGPAEENVASPAEPRWTIDQPAATSAPSPLAGAGAVPMLTLCTATPRTPMAPDPQARLVVRDPPARCATTASDAGGASAGA